MVLKKPSEFGRQRPLRGSLDTELLYAHGLNCVMEDRFEEMVATGFSLMSISGVFEHQADDFIGDGYRGWSQSDQFEQRQAAKLLSDPIDAVGQADYGILGWAVVTRLDILNSDERRDWSSAAYNYLADAPSKGHLPIGAADWVSRYAAEKGQPSPWQT